MTQRVNGAVKFFNSSRGFGFIKRDDDGSEVFVHVTALNKAKLASDVKEGMKVSFEIETGKEGKPRAINLKRG